MLIYHCVCMRVCVDMTTLCKMPVYVQIRLYVYVHLTINVYMCIRMYVYMCIPYEYTYIHIHCTYICV